MQNRRRDIMQGTVPRSSFGSVPGSSGASPASDRDRENRGPLQAYDAHIDPAGRRAAGVE